MEIRGDIKVKGSYCRLGIENGAYLFFDAFGGLTIASAPAASINLQPGSLGTFLPGINILGNSATDLAGIGFPMVAGETVDDGDVVIVDPAVINQVIKTTALADTLPLVVLRGASLGGTCIVGRYGRRTDVKCTAAAVAQKDTLVTSATAGRAAANNLIVNPKQIVGYAFSGKAGGAEGAVNALLGP